MPTKKKAPPKRKPRWAEDEVLSTQSTPVRKIRYSQADLDSALREQYESLKKEPNLHDNLEEAKGALSAWDQEVEHRQRALEIARDHQAEAKRAVQLAAAALVAAAKEAQRNL